MDIYFLCASMDLSRTAKCVRMYLFMPSQLSQLMLAFACIHSDLWAQQQLSHLLILTGGKATDLCILSELGQILVPWASPLSCWLPVSIEDGHLVRVVGYLQLSCR